MNQSMQIRSALTGEQLPSPSTAWIQSVVASQSSAPAPARTLPALVATAKAQLLGSDWTTPGLFDGVPPGFPQQLLGSSAGSVQETRLPQDVIVQVLDIENLSQSRWQQVQALEAIERGEQKRGREIIRVATDGEGGEGSEETDSPSTGSGGAGAPGRGAAGRTQAPPDTNATHRLVLQDVAGNKVFAVELVRIPRIGIGRLRIGEKLVLKAGTVAARGTLLLDPTSVKFLGGQVEAMNSAWLKGRLQRLREAAQTEQ